MYYVPNVGPTVQMTEEAVKWAERIGSVVEKAEFADLDTAKNFASRIASKVLDGNGDVVFDAVAIASD